MTITFATNCWEGDWRYLLIDGHLKRKIKRCRYPFDKKTLIISNVNDLDLVKRYAQKAIDKGIIDEYFVVADYEEEVLSFFETPRESFQSLNYFIGCATALYKCRTDYFLFFTGDAYIDKKRHTWVQDAMAYLENNPNAFAANPLWNWDLQMAVDESYEHNDEVCIGHGFSDQCFMVRTSEAQKPIYGEDHPSSSRYPEYGGGAYEKRVNSYMRNHERPRITGKKASYIHKNYPKKRNLWTRFLRCIEWKHLKGNYS